MAEDPRWDLKAAVAVQLKSLFASCLYPYPLSQLLPERQYLFFDSLWRTRAVPGDIIEVGCFQCGTSAIASKFLRNIESDRAPRKRYIAMDTFSGFVPEQFAREMKYETPARLRRSFSRNSHALVRKLLRNWEAADRVETMQADIVTVDGALLPGTVSVCLLDADIYSPVLAGLNRVFPRVSPGGIILVDDCDEKNEFAGARRAYEEFVRQEKLKPQYRFGMGIIEKGVREAP